MTLTWGAKQKQAEIPNPIKQYPSRVASAYAPYKFTNFICFFPEYYAMKDHLGNPTVSAPYTAENEVSFSGYRQRGGERNVMVY